MEHRMSHEYEQYIDQDYIKNIGRQDRVDHWRDVCKDKLFEKIK